MTWNSLRMLLTALAIVALALPTEGGLVEAGPAAASEQMVSQVNRVRAEHGLAPLEVAATLEALAFERSADMAARRCFSHTMPEGVDVFVLMEQRGIQYQAAAENLAWNTYGEDQATAVALQSFLDSPLHRDNLLNPEFTQIGVGVARDGARSYFTLIFIG